MWIVGVSAIRVNNQLQILMHGPFGGVLSIQSQVLGQSMIELSSRCSE
jgi:hypothetical protein